MTEETAVAPVAAQKDALRRRFRAVRAAIPASERAAAAERLAGVFLAAETIPAAAVVSAYWPLGDEMDPRPLLTALRGLGVSVALPVTGEKRTPLTFRLWDGRSRLVPGRFGTMVPGPHHPQTIPDVVLTPLLAFDRHGGRLGYGGGYYDRTLAQMREMGRSPRAFGLAYAAQEAESLPLGPFDRRLDGVCTEIALFRTCEE